MQRYKFWADSFQIGVVLTPAAPAAYIALSLLGIEPLALPAFCALGASACLGLVMGSFREGYHRT